MTPAHAPNIQPQNSHALCLVMPSGHSHFLIFARNSIPSSPPTLRILTHARASVSTSTATARALQHYSRTLTPIVVIFIRLPPVLPVATLTATSPSLRALGQANLRRQHKMPP